MKFLDFALACDELDREEENEGMLRTVSRAANDNEAALKQAQAEVELLKAKLSLASKAAESAEAKVAAAEAEKVALEAEKAAAEVAAAEREQKLSERYRVLHDDYAASQKEVAEQLIAWDLLNKDFKEIETDKLEAEADLERLQAGIPALFKTALGSEAVMEPFKEFAKALREIEFLETVELFNTHVPGLPDPLPEPISSRINPDCHARAVKANEALKQISVPFLDEIGKNMELSVEEILNMKP